MNLAEVRAGIAALLQEIPAFEDAGSPWQVNGYMIGSPTPPSFEVGTDTGDTVEYDLAMQSGSHQWRFVIRAYVASGVDQRTQEIVDLLVAGSGTYSVKAALEADPTLGGTVDDSQVVSARGPIRYSTESGTSGLSGSSIVGAEWTLLVIE